MAEHEPGDDEHPKWPGWTWVALLALACVLTGFVLWQEQKQVTPSIGSSFDEILRPGNLDRPARPTG